MSTAIPLRIADNRKPKDCRGVAPEEEAPD